MNDQLWQVLEAVDFAGEERAGYFDIAHAGMEGESISRSGSLFLSESDADEIVAAHNRIVSERDATVARLEAERESSIATLRTYVAQMKRDIDLASEYHANEYVDVEYSSGAATCSAYIESVRVAVTQLNKALDAALAAVPAADATADAAADCDAETYEEVTR